jgi:hypothetical protein
MPKKQSSNNVPPPESKKKLKSFMPIIKNGWLIKFSLYQDTEVLVVFMSLYTHQVVVRHFTGEDKAVSYINFVVDHDANKTWLIN